MTTHMANGWKTDGKYGLYRRTAADDKGEGAGVEVLLEEYCEFGEIHVNDEPCKWCDNSEGGY